MATTVASKKSTNSPAATSDKNDTPITEEELKKKDTPVTVSDVLRLRKPTESKIETMV